jgi:hypothetical protein
METFVAPLTLEDLPESFRPTLKAVRSPAGKALVLDENMFIEQMLPSVTQRALTADEMADYRRPFRQAGDDRGPTLQWAREVPLSGEPPDVHDRIAAYSAWLTTAPLPKLFIDAEPGVFITGRVRSRRAAFPTSTASSSEACTSCRRTTPTRSDGPSPTFSNESDQLRTQRDESRDDAACRSVGDPHLRDHTPRHRRARRTRK